MLTTLLTIAAVLGTTPPPGPTSRPAQPPSTQPATRPAAPGTPAAIGGAGHVIRRVETAHGLDAWRNKALLRCELDVDFGGEPLIDGTLHYDLAGGRSRLELEGGAVLVFDGKQAWVSPADADAPMARFHLRTWPYFIAAPFKLRDPGARVQSDELRSLDGKLCETLRLTFRAGTGDTPDDWYLLYVDPADDTLAAMAYIVTYGGTAGDAANDPHAIVYGRPVAVDGVTLATDWTFRSWTEREGVTGEPIGAARVRNVSFGPMDEALFEKPDGAREDELPK